MWLPTEPMVRLFSSGLLLLLLAGCGFQLRGTISLPAEMERVFVQGSTSHQPLALEIERAVRSGGGEVVGDALAATGLLQISGVKEVRRVISVDGRGKAQEYGLLLSFTFALQDGERQPLIGAQAITIERTLLYDSDNVLGSAEEESTLRGEMRQFAVGQMFRRINASLR